MSADYNGWADRPEEEREAEEAAEEEYKEPFDLDELLIQRYAA